MAAIFTSFQSSNNGFIKDTREKFHERLNFKKLSMRDSQRYPLAFDWIKN